MLKATKVYFKERTLMTYTEALEYIHSVTWKGSRPGLERITELCRLLGNPERELRFIHVAGTNGKGSICRMLSEILTVAGYRVGLFTSPYIEHFNERIMLDGDDIADDDLASATELVKQFADTMEDSPTEFELITAIAFVYYRRMGCDIVVLEAGLGGRLDSTNVISDAELSVITGIDLDHTELLGDTTSKIAAEKAGIIKPSSPVLFGEGDDSAEQVIRDRALQLGAPYYRTNFSAVKLFDSSLVGTRFEFDGTEYCMKMLGLFQLRNAATVLSAVKILRRRGFDIPERAAKEGIARAYWKARFERLSDSPLVIYDGGHNPQGIRGAVENIQNYLSGYTPDGKVVLLMGVMADKAHREMISELSSVAAHAYCVTPNNARSLSGENMAAEFESFGVCAESFEELEAGVGAACSMATAESRPLVCLGSLYMYADVKRAVYKFLNV